MKKTIVLTGLLLLVSCFMVPVLAQTPGESPSDYLPNISTTSSQKTQSTSEGWSIELFSVWDTTQNVWQERIKRTATRNAQNEPLEILDQINWTGSYENLNMLTGYYSPTTGQLDSMTEQSWNGSIWLNFKLETFAYDSLGDLYEDVNYLWNDTTNTYDLASGTRKTLQYGPSQEILTVFRETLAPPNYTWEPLYLTTNSYDSNMEIDTILTERSINGTWTGLYREFDIVWEDFSQGLRSEWVQQDYLSGNYVNSRKTAIVRTPGMETFNDSAWVNNAWELSSIDNRTYDVQDCIDLEEQFNVFNGNLQFSFGYDYQNTYNGNGEPTEIIVQRGNTNQVYTNSHKYDYSYPAVGLLPSEDGFSGMVAYPNPFTDQLHLRSDLAKPAKLNFVMVDAMGKVVFEQAWNASEGIFTEDLKLTELANGMYHYSISDGRRVHTGNLVRH